jgi:hypothetical protein
MKAFDSCRFDPIACRKEVAEFRQWLAQYPILDEKQQILPFFRQRRQLSAFVASYDSALKVCDRIAFEYPLFGDFTCDLVLGDSARNAYCLIEFEDAGPGSLFIKRGKRVTREWSPRFEHGYSVASRRIECVTFDDLARDFGGMLAAFLDTKKPGGR